MTILKISLLGAPRIELDNAALAFDTRKAVALLAFLAVSGSNVTREALATLLFPEYEAERAYANLRRTLWTLNKAGLGPWLDIHGDRIGLARNADLWIDVAEFHRLTAGAPALQDLETAAALQQGDFLAGFSLKDSAAFDEWQFFQAETLRGELAGVLERLSGLLADQGAYAPAIIHARRWVALDPLHEPAQRRLMRLYAQAGQRAAAIRQYQECAQILKAELAASPEAETEALYAAIAKGPPRRPWDVGRPPIPIEPVQPARPVTPLNLPIASTPFVGRQREVEQIQALLADSRCRLLTLLGLGGIGKTRLAVRAAAEALPAFPDGICFVALDAVRTPDLLPSAIVQALRTAGMLWGDGLAAGNQAQVLLRSLHEKRALLVLDNFEHLRPAAALLSEILAQAAGVKLLVTTRARLGLQEEWLFDVGGLDYPAAIRSEPAELEGYSAVALFMQGALRAWPDFRLTPANAPHIARICQLVEGWPLGIELAAAWLRALPCHEIVAEVECGLDLLGGSLSNIPDRHRSLRVVFDSSWQMLSAQEQDAFKQLTIFHGGFGRSAAATVAGADLLILSGLLDKSWLRRRQDGRFEIHELLRQYGGEKLDENTRDGIAARDRHSRYYLGWLARLTGDLKGRRQMAALAEIRQELDNVRAAWEWAVERQDWAALAAAAECLWIYYFFVSAFAEGERVFRRAAGRLAEVASVDRAEDAAHVALLGCLLARQGACSLLTAQFDPARELLQRGLGLCQQAGDQAETAFALNQLGNLAYASGELEVASNRYRESLALRRGLPDRWSTASSLYNLGSLLGYFGQYEEARRLCVESLTIRRDLNDRVGLAIVLGDLGSIALHQGDLAEARRYFTERQAIRRELPDDIVVPHSYSRGDLSDVAYQEGDYTEAAKPVDQTLASLRRVGNVWNIPFALGRLALIRAALGDYAEARKLLEESLGLAGERMESLATAHLLTQLGQVLAAMGDYADAGRRYERALVLARERMNPPEIAAALAGLGQAALAQGAMDRAEKLCGEALRLYETMGGRPGQAAVLLALGEIALAAGELSLARQRLTDAHRAAEEIGAAPLARATEVSLAAVALAEHTLLGAEPGVEADETLPYIADQLARARADPRTAHHVRRRAETLSARLVARTPTLHHPRR
jgi:predicted ATPase/DNA-binding SARP family transcriptional activator